MVRNSAKTWAAALAVFALGVGASCGETEPSEGTGGSTTGAVSADSGSTGPQSATTTSASGSTPGEEPGSSSSGERGESSSGDPGQACVALADELRGIAEQYQASEGLVGLSVAVRAGDCEPWSASWGLAELPDTALSPDHLLRVGSVTKMYTAALLLTLADEGLLSLDDTLEMWGSDVPNAAEITLRQLLNHTSGLADYQNNPDFTEALVEDPDQVWAPEVLVDYATALPSAAPGAAHAYSNANYILAAMVAESAGGEPYDALLRARLLGPLGLQHTYLEGAEDWDDPTALGYLVVAGGPPQSTAGRYHGSLTWSSGAVVATADDVRQWIDALLTRDVLSAESQTELVELVDGDAAEGYGLGIFRVQFEDVTAFGHNGAVMGFQAGAFYDPGTETSVAVLHNQLAIDAAGAPAGDPTRLAVELLSAADGASE